MFWMLFISLAIAEDKEVQPQVVYKKETEIDFEGVEVEGQMIKPHGSVITDRKVAAFNPLIQLRTDFQPEMRQSVNDVK